MPNRIIKESINESKGLSEVSFFAEDLYKRLITYADDYGRFNADYQIILARLYPREIQIVTVDDIEDAMTELIGANKVQFYTSSAKKEIYGCLPNWSEHQRVRNSKKKNPEPENTEINDYYLKRHIPYELKKKIVERDKFKCKECGRFICSTPISSERFIKMGTGLYHIDHIVPVTQGGRATEENLRLLCPQCNLTRKRKLTFDDILEETQKSIICEKSPQVAAKISEGQRNSALIQSNPNPNPIQYISSSDKSSEDICPERFDNLSVPEANVEAIPLNDGTEWRPTFDECEEFKRLFPAVDIEEEFRKMRAWCLGNRANLKTRRGVKRFVTGWLSRTQDRSHSTGMKTNAKAQRLEKLPF